MDRHPAFDRCECQKKKRVIHSFAAYKRHPALHIWSTELEQQQPTTHINKPHTHTPLTSSQPTTSIAQRPAGSSAANSARNKEKSWVPRSPPRSRFKEEMEKAGQEHVIGIPVNNRAFGIEEPDFPSKGAAKNATAAGGRAAKFGRTGDRVAQGLKEHGKFSDPTKSRMLLSCILCYLSCPSMDSAL